MQSNLDNKVSSLFKEKKQSNTKIRIKLYSDSEDNESDYDKNPLESNNILDKQSNSLENKNNSSIINIDLDENKENIKSSSQSSNSTSASQSNNSSNSKNFPARTQNSKKSDNFSGAIKIEPKLLVFTLIIWVLLIFSVYYHFSY